MTDPHFHVKAALNCGTIIEIDQPEPGMNFDVTLTPKNGIAVSDFAAIKDNKLIIRTTIESLAGVYRLLQLMAGDSQPPRKKIFGIF